ncbi:MAG: hypothetical protein JSW50_04305 [Candidatus Latescibacterota bacterium]|nr:MAG: hypothetical protein JSW50_04305 [Candidatus Latescibacterota bacterium]
MKQLCPAHIIPGFLVLGLTALIGCGGGESSKATISENDGEELVQLMQGVRTAIQQEDQARFEGYFPAGSNAKSLWKWLMKTKWDEGGHYVMQLLEHPEIERASTELHVEKLAMCVWFEIDKGYKTHNEIQSVTWTFERGDSGWGLNKLRFDPAHTSYGDIIRDLNRMDHYSYEALAMDWEERVDPSPVLMRTLTALGNEDLDALKVCTVDGTMFVAFSKGIEFPNLASGNTVSGRSNRDGCAEFLNRQIKAMREASGELKVNAVDLERYVTAYRVLSMPRNCTKLKMAMSFAQPTVPDHVTAIKVSWAASYVMQKWLAEYVGVDRIEFKG